MNVHCTATVVHTNLEIYWTAVVKLFCSIVGLHLNNYVTTFLVANLKIKLYLAVRHFIL